MPSVIETLQRQLQEFSMNRFSLESTLQSLHLLSDLGTVCDSLLPTSSPTANRHFLATAADASYMTLSIKEDAFDGVDDRLIIGMK